MRLRYAPEALCDLTGIQKYVQEDLSSPKAAEKIIRSITADCNLLKGLPKLGMELSKRIGRKTDCRFLVTGNSIVFYTIGKDTIDIFRVVDVRTDYIRTLGLAAH